MESDEPKGGSGGASSDAEIEESSALGDDFRLPNAGKVVRDLQKVKVVPSHIIAQRRGVGRPKTIQRAATIDDLEYHAIISQQKEAHIEADPLVRAIDQNLDTVAVLHHVKSEMAKETAALQFQRFELEKIGKDTTAISTRRLEGLSKVASVELEIKKLGTNTIDLRGERFQRVLKYLIDKMRVVAEATLAPEQIDLFFNRLSTDLDGWEDECEAYIASGPVPHPTKKG